MFQLVNRQPSYDHVRKIVQEEGRAARNLVTWNVPLDDQGGYRDHKSSHCSLNERQLSKTSGAWLWFTMT